MFRAGTILHVLIVESGYDNFFKGFPCHVHFLVLSMPTGTLSGVKGRTSKWVCEQFKTSCLTFVLLQYGFHQIETFNFKLSLTNYLFCVHLYANVSISHFPSHGYPGLRDRRLNGLH